MKEMNADDIDSYKRGLNLCWKW